MNTSDITVRWHDDVGWSATQATNADQRRATPRVYWMVGQGSTPQQAIAELMERPLCLTAAGDPYPPARKEGE